MDFDLFSSSFKGRTERKNSITRSGSFKIKYENVSRSCSFKNKGELCSCPSLGGSAVNEEIEDIKTPTEKKAETICVTLTYKPRI